MYEMRESVGCRSRLLLRGKERSRLAIVGVRNDEINGTISQSMEHSNEQTLGQNPPLCDSIQKIWMVSADIQAGKGSEKIPSRERDAGTLSTVTRVVYSLNRFHSSWERFLDKD